MAASQAATQPISVHPWSGGQVLRTTPLQSIIECRSLEQCAALHTPVPPPTPTGLSPVPAPPAPAPPEPVVAPKRFWLDALHPEACATTADTRTKPKEKRV